jgi:S1-C subfamily serine protease
MSEDEIANHQGGESNAVARLEHITGSARDTVSWLAGDALDVYSSDNHVLKISAARSPSEQKTLARFRISGDSYEVEGCLDSPIWINGERVEAKRLSSGDLIEFGEQGPLCRFMLSQDGIVLRKTMSDIFTDYIDYFRASRRPRVKKFARAVQNLLSSLTLRTTLIFRCMVIVVLLGLSVATFIQMRSSAEIKQRLSRGADRMEEFAGVLSRTREETVRSGDLNAFKQDFARYQEMSSTRLSALEQQSDAVTNAIGSSAAAVVFLQGAYGFREVDSQRMLRYVVDSQGRPLLSASSQPLLTLEGDGPIAQREFTGTAFVIDQTGTLLTNRHVALPWEQDTQVDLMTQRGMEPLMIKFIGYIPDSQSQFDVDLIMASEDADLAILKCTGITSSTPPLQLSETKPVQGDRIIVMGYPTGLRSMLAQTGAKFIDKLYQGKELGFWQIAENLASNHFINPLASQGIVAQITSATVVYDAETAHGGSGGPVLNMEGEVVAVNAAIIPGYSGSNIGVPVDFARRLLEKAGLSPE